MLIDVEFINDPGLKQITNMISGGTSDKRIGRGQYLCGHWSLHYSFVGWDDGVWEDHFDLQVNEENFHSHGVCDSPEQFMEKLGKHLESSSDEYVVCFVRLRKDEQYESGGWRWHKWGEYIGNQEPKCEYLYDEPVIEEVYTYHFYKMVE